MTTNPYKEYKENFRGSLPSGVTYDSNTASYFYKNDRFKQPWEVERYRNSVSQNALLGQIVNGFRPEYVLDFKNRDYFSGATVGSLSDAATFARSGNATMVDSDGVIKWAPHNFLTYSEDFSEWGATKFGSGVVPVVTDNGDYYTITLDRGSDGIGDQSQIVSNIISGVSAGTKLKAIVRIRAASPADIGKEVSVRHAGISSYGVATLTADWQDFEREETSPSGSNFSCTITNRGTVTADTTVSFDIQFAYLHRSDLGGMVNNPLTSDSYVPTTSAAVYLPREGHHVYKPEEGAIIGPELVTNGTFEDGLTGWTDGSSGSSSITVSDGTLTFNVVGGDAARATTSFSVEAGKTYKVSETGTYATFAIGTSSGASDVLAYVAGDTRFFTAATTGTYWFNTATATGGLTLETVSVREVNPWVNEGLLLESEARTNLINNSQFEGAVVGTVGSGGSLPTNWSSTSFDSVEVVSIDTYRGAPRIRIKGTRANATGSAVFPAILLGSSTFAASTAYTYGAFVQLGSDFANVSSCNLLANDGVGNFIIKSILGATETEFIYDTQTSAVGAGAGSARVAGTVDDGETGVVDFYISMPQLEAGSTPSSFIPTTGAASDRAAETLTAPAANLPWPTPNVIGDELVTNGTFDTDSDWTKGTGWTLGSGVASSDGTQAGNSEIFQLNIATVGKVYQVSYDVTAYTAGQVRLNLGQSFSEYVSATGSYTYTLVAASDAHFRVQADVDFVGSVDNVSIREIDPLAVSIQMEGTMTFADTDQVYEVYPIRCEADTSNYIRHRLRTSAGANGLYDFLQSSGGTADVVLDTTGGYSTGINVPFNIASRHGSTFINGAVDGTALTADTTPVALPDLSATDLQIGFDFMGTIKRVRIWDADIGDAGIVEASS